ncbi:DUF397 domain-containing protein [Streptomyces sp. NPDC090798]|uniref:DUF397 domain-containing protein n=1 Tax=Streptomyces sp. NPDC090798 TaxID=3365968 RepID=UPI00381505E3
MGGMLALMVRGRTANCLYRDLVFGGVDGRPPGVIPVPDSKVTDGPVLLIGSLAWTAFLRTVVK